jgi:hypothetical protein
VSGETPHAPLEKYRDPEDRDGVQGQGWHQLNCSFAVLPGGEQRKTSDISV